MSNTAQSVMLDSLSNVLLRVIFLYVGQGSSAIIFAKSGQQFEVSLLDINMDRAAGGIDVPRLVRDLVGEVGLTWFVNTHPHDDHLSGLDALSEEVTIRGVMHSGHIPSRKHGSTFKQLEALIKKVRGAGDPVVVLKGSRTSEAFGEAQMHILSPAEYVTDEVNEEEADTRYNRIHEQCAVLRFGDGTNWIMIPGDADHVAFKEHIMYHKANIRAFVLAASHHGSRTFFMTNDDDEPFLDAIQAIAPTYVVVSAPTQDESRHDHPHDEAMDLYEDAVGEGRLWWQPHSALRVR